MERGETTPTIHAHPRLLKYSMAANSSSCISHFMVSLGQSSHVKCNVTQLLNLVDWPIVHILLGWSGQVWNEWTSLLSTDHRNVAEGQKQICNKWNWYVHAHTKRSLTGIKILGVAFSHNWLSFATLNKHHHLKAHAISLCSWPIWLETLWQNTIPAFSAFI